MAAHVATAADLPAAAALIAEGASRLLGVAATVGPVVDRPILPRADHSSAVPQEASPPPTDDGVWSLGLHAGAEWRLHAPGLGTSPRVRACVAEFAVLLRATLQAPALRQLASRTEAIVAAGYAFSRRLARTHGSPPLRQVIVDTMSAAARARLGALALYGEDEGHLRVAATHGYPHVLVEHVRTLPGHGVIGRVFESRQPLLVRDVLEWSDAPPRRPRYRTRSFLAVPLLANGDALGVVCLADRADNQPFDRADLTAARALTAPAALALINDRLSEQTRALAHAASVDPLTGLFNRRYFHTRIEEELERARRYGLDLALLLADIDNFKQLNDQLGHLAGDYLLRQIAEVLKRSVRVFDVCTRFGGEEFAILMPGSNVSNALAVAERIRARVESAAREDGPLPPHLRVTISLGLAVVSSETTSPELIARADRALYRAKEEGKNRVRME